MTAQARINYAVTIKHWCDNHPNATDQELVEFLEEIERRVARRIFLESKEKRLDI